MARIFTEENVRYRVDEQGGVHFAIDEEFERNRAATLGILSDGKYANVLNQFNEAHRAFDAVPPNGKTAIRATFAAAEALFRLMFPSAPRLTSKEIDKHLAPTLRLVHAGDATALNAGSKLLASFKEWVDAAHFYRHEQGKETIVQPPLALAINVVSEPRRLIHPLARRNRYVVPVTIRRSRRSYGMQPASVSSLTLLSRHVRLFVERPPLGLVGLDQVDDRPEFCLLGRAFRGGRRARRRAASNAPCIALASAVRGSGAEALAGGNHSPP
jgi:hypothetical protein